MQVSIFYSKLSVDIERKPDYIWKCIKGKQGFENTSLYKYWCEFLNIILNQLLISSHTTISVFGMLLSIPGAGLGVRGAAIATAISQGIGGVTIFGLQCKIHW